MQPHEILEHLEQLADRLGVTVKTGRYEGKGGMAKVRGEWILLVDRSMEDDARIALFIDELSRLDYENQYIAPLIRERLDRAARRNADRSQTASDETESQSSVA